MSDRELRDARRLAELQDTSVSAALAAAATTTLQAVLRKRYVDAVVELLTAAAIRSAQDQRSKKPWSGKVLYHLPFTRSREAYAWQGANVQRPYDDAILSYAQDAADEAAALGELDAGMPYEAVDDVMVFFYWDSEFVQHPTGTQQPARTVRLLVYCQPWDAITERPDDSA
jgi:hypothetical protein